MRLFTKFNAVKVAAGLLLVNTAFWLVSGWITLLRPAGGGMNIILGVLVLGNSGGMFLCHLAVRRGRKWFFLPVLFFLALNLVLTVTDEIGFWDWATLALDLVIVGMLLGWRRQIFHRNSAASGG